MGEAFIMMVYDVRSTVSTLVPAIFGIIGVAVGGWITSINNKRERQQRLLQQKLAEFYGPLLAIRSRIKAKSELRLKISQFAGEEWPKLIAAASEIAIERGIQVEKERWPEYEKIMEYESKQLREEILPAYREMVSLFVSKMYLAESGTREHLAELINFVEVWDRWTDGSLPKEILPRLDHSEKRLYPLYENLEKKFAALQHTSWRS
jgi:hypothetical protein